MKKKYQKRFIGKKVEFFTFSNQSLIYIFALIGVFLFVVFLKKITGNSSTVKGVSSGTQTVISSPRVYPSGQKIDNYKFSFTYPPSFRVILNKDAVAGQNLVSRASFDMAPPAWKVKDSASYMGWRIMYVDIYPMQSSIDTWLSSNLSLYQGGVKITNTYIGNKKAYLLSANGKTSWSKGWIDRYIVLGSTYSYQIGFNNNGEGLNTRIEREIFPGFIFE